MSASRSPLLGDSPALAEDGVGAIALEMPLTKPHEAATPVARRGMFAIIEREHRYTGSPYERAPPRLAVLHAREVPSPKGGTMFADVHALPAPHAATRRVPWRGHLRR